MAERPRHVLICSCEDTMPLDAGALKRGLPRQRGNDRAPALPRRARTLPRRRRVGAPLTVGCTQEAPLFSEVAWESGSDIRYANIRETAGWSTDAAAAGPKMAALIAMAAEPSPEIPFVTLDERRRGPDLWARRTRHRGGGARSRITLDVTVLIRPPAAVMPPRITEFPVVKGTIRAAKGHLGAFELIGRRLCAAGAVLARRARVRRAKNGAVSRCDLVLDLSGGAPLFTAPTCATAICAPIRAIRPRCCEPC